jgi:hypothetical protein
MIDPEWDAYVSCPRCGALMVSTSEAAAVWWHTGLCGITSLVK